MHSAPFDKLMANLSKQLNIDLGREFGSANLTNTSNALNKQSSGLHLNRVSNNLVILSYYSLVGTKKICELEIEFFYQPDTLQFIPLTYKNQRAGMNVRAAYYDENSKQTHLPIFFENQLLLYNIVLFLNEIEQYFSSIEESKNVDLPRLKNA